MRVHGLAVQQERFLGQGHDFHESSLNPDVPTPECVEWLLTTSIFLIDVMLFTNPRSLLFAYFLVVSLCIERRSLLPLNFFLRIFCTS